MDRPRTTYEALEFLDKCSILAIHLAVSVLPNKATGVSASTIGGQPANVSSNACGNKNNISAQFSSAAAQVTGTSAKNTNEKTNNIVPSSKQTNSLKSDGSSNASNTFPNGSHSNETQMKASTGVTSSEPGEHQTVKVFKRHGRSKRVQVAAIERLARKIASKGSKPAP